MLTPQQERKLKKLAKFADDSTLATVEEFDNLDEKVDELATQIETVAVTTQDAIDAISEELKKKLESELVLEIDKAELKGDKGENGKDGVDGKDGKDGKNGLNGKDGLNGRDGVDGVDGKDGKDGSPDTGEQIIDKVNLDESGKKIRAEKVEGFTGYTDEVKTLQNRTQILNQLISGLDRRLQDNADADIGGTIAATQVAYGTAANTIGGSNNLTYDGTTFVLGNIANKYSGSPTNAYFDSTGQDYGLEVSGEPGLAGIYVHSITGWGIDVETEAAGLPAITGYSDTGYGIEIEGGLGGAQFTNDSATGKTIFSTQSNAAGYNIYADGGISYFNGNVQITGNLTLSGEEFVSSNSRVILDGNGDQFSSIMNDASNSLGFGANSFILRSVLGAFEFQHGEEIGSGITEVNARTGSFNAGTELTSGKFGGGNGLLRLYEPVNGSSATITVVSDDASLTFTAPDNMFFFTDGIVNATSFSGSGSALTSLNASNISSGTLGVGYGGTGITSYAIGDLIYASGATTLSKLADVATGNALISGGVGVAPSWGKIGLTTHISGTLAIGNGGTGATTFTAGRVLLGNGTTNIQEDSNLFFDTANDRLGIGTGSSPATPLHVINTASQARFGYDASNYVNIGVNNAALVTYDAVGGAGTTPQHYFPDILTIGSTATSVSGAYAQAFKTYSLVSTAPAQNTVGGIIEHNVSSTNASYSSTAFSGRMTTNFGSANHSDLRGFTFQFEHNGSGTVTNSKAMFALTQKTGNGSISSAVNIQSYLQSAGASGGITNAYHVYLNTPIGAVAAPITNLYGIYIDTQVATGVTNVPYAIYQRGTAEYNYFGSPIGIGTTVPTSLLHVLQGSDTTNTSTPVGLNVLSNTTSGELTASSGTQVWAQFYPYINQSSTAGYTVFKINVTETATGSGSKYLADWQTAGATKFNVSSNGDANLYGDTVFNGSGSGLPYGGCYGNEIAWTQASAVQNTWYLVSDVDMSDMELNLVTHDGSGKLTVTKAGRYLVHFTSSVESSLTNKHVQLGVSKNGASPAYPINHFEILTANTQLELSGNAIISCAANDTIEVAMRTTDTGTPDLSVDHLNITVVQVGG